MTARRMSLDNLPREIWEKFAAVQTAAQRATAGLSYGEICDAQYEAQETLMRELGVKRPPRRPARRHARRAALADNVFALPVS